MGAAFVAGCTGGDTTQTLRRENLHLQEQLADAKNQLVARQVTIDGLNQQLAVAREISADDLKRIYYPEKLLIERLSGGEDYDGKPGDDGITVYLQPIDRTGDAVKAAGDVRIQLYDLANPPGDNLVGEYDFPVDELAQLWYGKLMTYHYSLKCPWRGAPPKHTELTIRATFVDYLTQRVITAQTTCTFTPPPHD